MLNLVIKVGIKRSSRNGRCHELVIYKIGQQIGMRMGAENFTDTNEDNATRTLIMCFLTDLDTNYPLGINIDTLEPCIRQGFHHMREDDLSGNSKQTREITIERDPHYLCKTNKNVDSNGNEISPSELKQKIATFAKDSKVMQFFEDNKCSVCLSSYIEVLDENRHIVIPSCGHPLCCACADNILMSEKKECPRCRGYITADSFNLMKFNVDLEMNTQDQKVFL